MYLYLKAIHIIFVTTWFAGMFYMPRLFIYNTEANDKPENDRKVLQEQFGVMMKRLWYGITWPSAILTLGFGTWVMVAGGWDKLLFQPEGQWLLVKLFFVLALYAYFFSLHAIFKQQVRGVFKYTSQQLRIWNEVATIFLVAIVSLAAVKEIESFAWSIAGLVAFIIVLMAAIRIYKKLREKK